MDEYESFVSTKTRLLGSSSSQDGMAANFLRESPCMNFDEG